MAWSSSGDIQIKKQENEIMALRVCGHVEC